jgi:hypothetical protein
MVEGRPGWQHGSWNFGRLMKYELFEETFRFREAPGEQRLTQTRIMRRSNWQVLANWFDPTSDGAPWF